MIDHDNLAEYADPALYDCENDDFEPDGPFYLSIAQRVGGSALELGCGTGRITIPLAQHGIAITGLDVVPGMLARAQDKAKDLRICWVEADARSFHLDTQFHLVFAAGTFQHFLELSDQEAVLARVREHLVPKGYFAVAVGFPHPERLRDVEEEKEWFSYFDEYGRQVRVSGNYVYDPVKQISIETAYRRWHDSEGREVVRRAPLAQRVFFPQEMEALLHYNGFIVSECYGDWDLNPLASDSKIMICVCQKAE